VKHECSSKDSNDNFRVVGPVMAGPTTLNVSFESFDRPWSELVSYFNEHSQTVAARGEVSCSMACRYGVLQGPEPVIFSCTHLLSLVSLIDMVHCTVQMLIMLTQR